jgi:hypothetical protein
LADALREHGIEDRHVLDLESLVKQYLLEEAPEQQ